MQCYGQNANTLDRARNCEDMTICLRCEKTIFPDNPVSCHTCTPQGAWRKGMDEGIAICLAEITSLVDRNWQSRNEEFHYDTPLNDLYKILKLKQGKSDD